MTDHEIKALRDAQRALRVRAMVLRRVEGEYRVYPLNEPEQAYFTNDLADAVATGIEMHRASFAAPVLTNDRR